MRATLIRTDREPKRTFGLFDVDGTFVCHTLEDTDRFLEKNPTGKIYGETAIPMGIYPVVLDFSARFKRVLPHILGVPYFDGIRIHAGNTAADSHGCILVGDKRDKNGIAPGTSGPAMQRLMALFNAALARNEKITLEVR